MHGKIWCVESFDPRVLIWFRKNAPKVLRGQLSCQPKSFDNLKKPVAFLMGNLLTNVLSRPHFIAYQKGPKPLPARLCDMFRPMRVVWTVREEGNAVLCQKKHDTVIFENYLPESRYTPYR